MKIHHQSKRNVKQFHVTQQLGFVDRVNLLHGLYFNKQTIFHKYVESQFFSKHLTFEFDLYFVLVDYAKATQRKLTHQTLFINALQQSRAENSMDLNTCANHVPAEALGLLVFGVDH